MIIFFDNFTLHLCIQHGYSEVMMVDVPKSSDQCNFNWQQPECVSWHAPIMMPMQTVCSLGVGRLNSLQWIAVVSQFSFSGCFYCVGQRPPSLARTWSRRSGSSYLQLGVMTSWCLREKTCATAQTSVSANADGPRDAAPRPVDHRAVHRAGSTPSVSTLKAPDIVSNLQNVADCYIPHLHWAPP